MKKRQSKIVHNVLSMLKIFGISLAILSTIFVIGIFISPQPFYTQGFRTLAEVQKYAISTNELTPLESENAVKPDFTRYYKHFAPSITKTILDKIGGLFEKLRLKNPPAFTPSFFKTVLDDVNKIREQKGFKKENIIKVVSTAQSKFIVIGDLQAAFHSLVRDLGKLKELGILGEDLKLTAPDTYLIFLGNVPSRSPFSMETLGLVLRLMQQNPERVLYTKGSHESDGYWEEHTLQTELKIRAAGLSKDSTPLLSDVNKFFDSLPTIIYLAAPAPDKNAFVRFSRLTRSKLPDKNFAKFLMTEQKDAVSSFSWQANMPSLDGAFPDINVQAILRVEKKRETYQPSDGLRTLAPEMGITTWTLLSAPTLAVEQGFKFYNDTFAIIEAASSIEQWKITLFYQDRRKKDGYKTKMLFLTSGRETPAPAAVQQPVQQSVAPQDPPVAVQAQTVAGQPIAAQPQVVVQPATTLPQASPGIQPSQNQGASVQSIQQPGAAVSLQPSPIQPASTAPLPSQSNQPPSLPMQQSTVQTSPVMSPAVSVSSPQSPAQAAQPAQVPLVNVPQAVQPIAPSSAAVPTQPQQNKQ